MDGLLKILGLIALVLTCWGVFFGLVFWIAYWLNKPAKAGDDTGGWPYTEL